MENLVAETSENQTIKRNSRGINILLKSISFCLYNNKDFTVEEIQSLLNDSEKLSSVNREEIISLLDFAYSMGCLVKKETNNVLSYTFFTLLDNEKKICFPDGSFLYVKDAKDINEWRQTIYSGIKERFPQEAHYYQPA